MNTPSPVARLRRNLRVLLLLGFILTAVSALGGGALLILGYSHPEVVQPVWKSGQNALILGGTNLLVYLALFFQVRKVWSHLPPDPVP